MKSNALAQRAKSLRRVTKWVVTLMVPLCALQVATPARAEYPERPIRVIIPVGTGGGTDIVGRLIGRNLSEVLGQPVVIENRPAGGGNVGAAQVARSKPDGYTLLLTYGANVTVNPSLYRSAGFDPVRDFAPITQIASSPYLLVVHPGVKANSVSELISLMKTGKDNFTFASAAQGSPDHLAGEMFKMMAKVDMINIPYKSSAEGLLDVLGGRLQMAFVTIPSGINHVKSGALRALGVSQAQRAKLLPDVPPISDAVTGFDIATWYGMWAPAGTPSAIVDRLQREVRAVVQRNDVAESLARSGFVTVASTPAEFAAFSRAETEKYAAIVKAAKVSIE